MSDTSTIQYTDVLFGDRFNVPSIPPQYLISVISMIIRKSDDDDVKVIIKRDPLLKEVLFTDEGDQYNTNLILVLVRIIQQAYGIEFTGLGHFSKDNYFIKDEYKNNLFYKSISLIWNYSPVISSSGTLDVLKAGLTSFK